MLPDPLLLSIDSGQANMKSFALLPENAPGRTERQNASLDMDLSGGPQRLSIQHQQTKENNPLSTTRTLIRFAIPLIGSNAPTEKGTLVIQVTVSRPEMVDLTDVLVGSAMKGFIASLFASGTEATYDTLKAALVSTYFERIIAGEG